MRRLIRAAGLFAPPTVILYRLCMFTVNTRENAATAPCTTFDGFLLFRFARTGNQLPAVAAVVLCTSVRALPPPASQSTVRVYTTIIIIIIRERHKLTWRIYDIGISTLLRREPLRELLKLALLFDWAPPGKRCGVVIRNPGCTLYIV